VDTPTIDDDLDTSTEVRTFVAPFTLERAAEDGDGLTLTGYAAVFNSPTRISGYEGDFIEQIAPGAFKRSINANKPVMQFDHGQHPLIGSLPIASISKLREDAHGLYVEARVFDNWLTEPLRDAIRSEAISGMSFRFSVVKDTWSTAGKDRVRSLKEVRLYELGPVVHPAYADTSVALRSLERATGFHILGTSDDHDPQVSSDEPACGDPAPSHSTRSKAQRAAFAASLQLNLKGDHR